MRGLPEWTGSVLDGPCDRIPSGPEILGQTLSCFQGKEARFYQFWFPVILCLNRIAGPGLSGDYRDMQTGLLTAKGGRLALLSKFFEVVSDEAAMVDEPVAAIAEPVVVKQGTMSFG